MKMPRLKGNIDFLGTLLNLALVAIVIAGVSLFAIGISYSAHDALDQQNRVYKVIVPAPRSSFFYYCGYTNDDGGKLVLTDCASSPKITIENPINVQIIERGR